MKLCLNITVVLSFLVAGEPSTLFQVGPIKIRLTHNTYDNYVRSGQIWGGAREPHGGLRVVQLTKYMNFSGDTTLHCG